jgi:SAM-dependent methyltransferase
MPAPEALRRVARALRQVQPRAIGLRAFRCPYCGPTLLLRWARHEHAIRCLRCGAGAVHLSLGSALRRLRPSLAGLRVLELSSRGPLVRFLRRSGADLVLSEYLDGVEPGRVQHGIRCEDVQRLSFPDASFDLVTHTEVFEHVEDDRAGFAELRRVLSARGATVFSVPIDPAAVTRDRVQRDAGGLRHLLPPEYHDDRLRGPGKVLSWRDYGGDIVARLRAAGFARAWIAPPPDLFGAGRAIVLATCSEELPTISEEILP